MSSITHEMVAKFVEAALRIYPKVIEVVKAKIESLGKANSDVPADEIMGLMSRLIVEEVEQNHAEELSHVGLSAIEFLGFAYAHKAELDVFLVEKPEYKNSIDFFLSPFSVPPQPITSQ